MTWPVHKSMRSHDSLLFYRASCYSSQWLTVIVTDAQSHGLLCTPCDSPHAIMLRVIIDSSARVSTTGPLARCGGCGVCLAIHRSPFVVLFCLLCLLFFFL